MSQYYVIDARPHIATRTGAELLKADLERDNPNTAWIVVVAPPDDTDNPIERLYALAASLLEMTQANPVALALEIGKLDGSTETVSALTIMHQSRLWLDTQT